MCSKSTQNGAWKDAPLRNAKARDLLTAASKREYHSGPPILSAVEIETISSHVA